MPLAPATPAQLAGQHFDIVIVGSGPGGSTLAWALRDSGARVLVLERGTFLPREPQNWEVAEVFGAARYKADDRWFDPAGRAFRPGIHYTVGGNSKVFGCAMFRLRRSDFEARDHEDGTSPAWPLRYDDLAPWYDQAERLYRVHGAAGEDPSEPAPRPAFPFEAVPHEPAIEDLASGLRGLGLRPFHVPLAIDLHRGGACQRCRTCDGFPCQVLAKGDAELRCLRPALEGGHVTLAVNAFARRIATTPDGRRATAVEVEQDRERFAVGADRVVVACGAVNSAALLLRSGSAAHPAGLANASGLVGRNYMVHNNTALMAVDPRRRNPTVFQKTLGLNDFYERGPDTRTPFPLGNLQMLGKLQPGMLTATLPLMPQRAMAALAARSVDWWVMSEDLPRPDNRVTLRPDGTIALARTGTNLKAHASLVRLARRLMRRLGYPLVFTRRMGIDNTSHQCGTIRFGSDERAAVLDPFCRAFTVENLWVMDSSFFPSSAAVNPALTIAAQALRIAPTLSR